MSRTGRRAVLALPIAALLALALSACDPLTTPPPWAYGEVDRTVDELGITESGEVLLEAHAGGGLVGPPIFDAVIDGTDAHSTISEELEASGFTVDGTDPDTEVSTWTGKGADGGYALVILGGLEEGEKVSVGDGSSTTLDGPATYVSVSVYR